jgi:hypothetical protein
VVAVTATGAPDRPGAGPAPGGAVLQWLRTPEATARARAVVRRYDLPGGPATVDDVLGDATVAVRAWQRGSSAHDPDNPAAYGTQVLRSVARRIAAGRVRAVDGPLSLDGLGLDPPERSQDAAPPPEEGAGDEVRVLVERLGGPPWLVAAALSVVTFVIDPDAVPAGSPAPRAGSRPDQARVWPALDLAGQGDLFPGPDGDPPSRRRTRARRITAVLARLERAAAGLLRAGEGGGGD